MIGNFPICGITYERHAQFSKPEMRDMFNQKEIDLMSNRPRHVTPYIPNKDTPNMVSLSLHTLAVDLRWKFHIEEQSQQVTATTISDNIGILPFQQTRFPMPPKLDEERELLIQKMCKEIKEVVDHDIQYKRIRDKQEAATLQSARNKLRNHGWVAVPSDKTGRLVICDKTAHNSEVTRIFTDHNTYTTLHKPSAATSIENKANDIVRNLSNIIPLKTSEKNKLLSQGTQAANIAIAVKDHKQMDTIGNFPLRPIANVDNTPTQKIDWLLSQILVQLIPFVPAHIPNTADLTNKLRTLDTSNWNDNYQFLSLDVKALYPSIPLIEGIDWVIALLTDHTEDINMFNISVSYIKFCLHFICHNCIINFDGAVYKQIKGVPMGSHCAPIFAILCMHHVETIALNNLPVHLKPQLYARYVDDIIMGPYEHNSDRASEILQVFNGVNTSIQFTLENPKPPEPLNFLDLSITVTAHKVSYSWYYKPMHSMNSLRADSSHPNHTKVNFVTGRIHNVTHNSSSPDRTKSGLLNLDKVLAHNGYPSHCATTQAHMQRNRRQRYKSRHTWTDSAKLRIPFISDSTNRKIGKIIHKSKLPIKLLPITGPTVARGLQPYKPPTHCSKSNCNLCNTLQPRATCLDKQVVYKYECTLCKKCYIGQTCRQINRRHQEHARSISQHDKHSALSEHLIDEHPNMPANITLFSLSIIARSKNPKHNAIMEALLIKRDRPELNRKFECASL